MEIDPLRDVSVSLWCVRIANFRHTRAVTCYGSCDSRELGGGHYRSDRRRRFGARRQATRAFLKGLAGFYCVPAGSSWTATESNHSGSLFLVAVRIAHIHQEHDGSS